MTDPIAAAQERLDKAAVVVGSCLEDGIEVPWNDQVEYEAAAVHYVRALRGTLDTAKANP